MVFSGISPLAASDNNAPGGRLIVVWHGQADHQLVDSLAGVKTQTDLVGGQQSLVVAKSGQAASVAAALRANHEVAAVLADATVSKTAWPNDASAPNDLYYASYQKDLPLIGVPAAWKISTGSPSVVVAVLDTGITTTNPDLAGVKLVSPYNVLAPSSAPTDVNGHGTHVTGTIVAKTNNGTGVAGIAPGVSVMPVKVLGDNGSGYWSDFISGLNYAVAHGANIVNMSLGSTLSAAYVTSFQPAFDAAFAAGVTVVASAGNEGNSTVSYPCAFNHVICVAATDNTNAHASFSNINSYIDISAPGVSIASTYINYTYAMASGTSMSAPHIAAVAALVLSVHPADSPAQIEAALKSTATHLGAAGINTTFGAGQVNAGAAVAATPAVIPTAPSAPASVSAVSGNGTAVVSWAAPASNGGATVTKYTVTSSVGAKTCATTGALTCTVSGLTNGTAYTFSVVATNAVGNSAPATSAAITPATVPGAPGAPKATKSDRAALVAWAAPASNGGAPVTKYTVTSNPGSLSCITTGALTCTVSGLTNGTAYTFSVLATNAVGNSAAATAAAVTPATTPGAPASVTVTPSNGTAVVSWSAPASNGGSAITKYTVTSSVGAKTCSTTGTLTCTVSGLTNGTAYTFSVLATNAVGNSVVLVSTSVTPAAPVATATLAATASKAPATK